MIQHMGIVGMKSINNSMRLKLEIWLLEYKKIMWL